MEQRTCAVEGCTRSRKTREWCNAHYENWRRHGLPVLPWTIPFERIMSKVTQVESGCWSYDGYHDRKGYARTTLPSSVGQGKKTTGVHKFLYEHFEGEVTEPLQLDHLCRNRWCVNPGHLEVVTNQENAARGMWAMKTHCPRQHPYDEENTGWQGPEGRSRYCLTCARERKRRARAAA